MRLFILLILALSNLNSFGQESPILVIDEHTPGHHLNPTIVVYSDGTVIKNPNEPGEDFAYLIMKLDSLSFNDFLTRLNLKQLVNYETDYDCAPGVTDQNYNTIYYFGEKDTIQIEIYGSIRYDAFLLKHRDDFPDVVLRGCLPVEFSHFLSELLFFEKPGKEWLPKYFNAYTDGKWDRFRGERLEWYRNLFGPRVRYELPGEELWIKKDYNKP